MFCKTPFPPLGNPQKKYGNPSYGLPYFQVYVVASGDGNLRFFVMYIRHDPQPFSGGGDRHVGRRGARLRQGERTSARLSLQIRLKTDVVHRLHQRFGIGVSAHNRLAGLLVDPDIRHAFHAP